MLKLSATRVLLNASAFAISISALALPQAALAQSASDDEAAADDEEIVVTGTIVRGAAPVGSSIISLNNADIQKTGLLTTNEVLRSLPQVTGIGPGEAVTGSTANNANLNISRANALNIRGLGVQATLTLLNGRRLPVGGFGGQLFDPNSIPAIALARIDVVADGASATYGSDAVAGVANLVLRTDVDGVEFRARYGTADDYSNKSVSMVAGKRWSTGRVMVAAEWGKNDQLLQSDRPEYFSCNQISSGGTNNCAFGGAPGNIFYGSGNSIVRYGLPGGTGVGVTQSQLSATPNRLESYVYTTAIPGNERFNLVGSFRQEVTDSIAIWVEGFHYTRKGQFYVGSPSSGTNGAIPSTVLVPNTNPNFVTITGQSTAAQGVEYSIFNDLGEGRIASSTERGNQIAVGAEVAITDNWHFDASYTYNHNFATVNRTLEINNALLAKALACTTAGLCLNPYGSGGSASNRAALDTVLGFTNFKAWYRSHIVNAKVSGTLARIGGGDIKMAIGGQYLNESFRAYNISNSGTGPTSLSDIRVTANFGRGHTVKSVFAEVIVPFVGEDNAMPGVQRLQLNLAGRYDDYSDVGHTTNPKIGLLWEPVRGFTLRASYGKSFRAPTLTDNDPASTPSLSASTTAAGAGRNVLTLLGGNANVTPEKATTWSFGLEIKPEGIPGLFASLSYFNIDYKNVIDTPGNTNAVFTDAALASFLTLNPNKAQVDAIQALITSGFYRAPSFSLYQADGVTPNIYAIADGRKNNTGRIQMTGLDIQLGYQFASGIGDWNLGLSATRVFHYKFQAVPGGPTVDRLNNVNFPLRFKARAQVGWRSGGLSINTFLNYVNAYRAVSLVLNSQFSPALVSPATQNERIDSSYTVDATVTYAFPQDSGVLNGLSFSVSAQNLFDRAPPFARVSSSQEYDSGNASVLGRMVSFEVRKRF